MYLLGIALAPFYVMVLCAVFLFFAFRIPQSKYYRLKPSGRYYSKPYWLLFYIAVFWFISLFSQDGSFLDSLKLSVRQIPNGLTDLAKYGLLGLVYAVWVSVKEVRLTRDFLSENWKSWVNKEFNEYDSRNFLEFLKGIPVAEDGNRQFLHKFCRAARGFYDFGVDRTLVSFEKKAFDQYTLTPELAQSPFEFFIHKENLSYNLADKTALWPLYIAGDILNFVLHDIFVHIGNWIATAFNGRIRQYFKNAFKFDLNK
jgi:hypothetical protein